MSMMGNGHGSLGDDSGSSGVSVSMCVDIDVSVSMSVMLNGHGMVFVQGIAHGTGYLVLDVATDWRGHLVAEFHGLLEGNLPWNVHAVGDWPVHTLGLGHVDVDGDAVGDWFGSADGLGDLNFHGGTGGLWLVHANLVLNLAGLDVALGFGDGDALLHGFADGYVDTVRDDGAAGLGCAFWNGHTAGNGHAAWLGGALGNNHAVRNGHAPRSDNGPGNLDGDVMALPLSDGSAFWSIGNRSGVNMSNGVRGKVDMMSGGKSKRGKGSNGGEGTGEGTSSNGSRSGNKRSGSRNKTMSSGKDRIGSGINGIESRNAKGRHNSGSKDSSSRGEVEDLMIGMLGYSFVDVAALLDDNILAFLVVDNIHNGADLIGALGGVNALLLDGALLHAGAGLGVSALLFSGALLHLRAVLAVLALLLIPAVLHGAARLLCGG